MTTDANTIKNTIQDVKAAEAQPVHVHQPPPPPSVEMCYRVINSNVLPGGGQSHFGRSPVPFDKGGSAIDHAGRSSGVHFGHGCSVDVRSLSGFAAKGHALPGAMPSFTKPTIRKVKGKK